MSELMSEAQNFRVDEESQPVYDKNARYNLHVRVLLLFSMEVISYFPRCGKGFLHFCQSIRAVRKNQIKVSGEFM